MQAQLANSGPGHTPTNHYRQAETLPRSFKRVALLPLTSRRLGDIESSRAALEQALHAELSKGARFEVVVISPSELRQWTGRTEWSASDPLPQDFFIRIQAGSGCDGVLFAELTEYKPYPPLAIGWRLQLLDVNGPSVWWAVDELFDASESTVANSARRYHLAHAGKPLELTDAGEILISPRRFGSYTASAVVATCPGRAGKP